MSLGGLPVSAIFLDDGGVISDNSRRASEWQRLVGECLSPRLGGDSGAWAEANRVVFADTWRRYERALHETSEDAYDALAGFWITERERWLREMCKHVGVRPPDPEDCLRIAEETEAYVIPRVRAAYPGAVDALCDLHAQGYTLSTASAETSSHLEGYLSGMGVRDIFTPRLYGPDLVNVRKESPRFYQRLLADLGVEPTAALVVDDSEEQLHFAAEAGAKTVLVSAEPPATPAAHAVIASLAGLPSILDQKQSVPPSV